MNADTLRSLAGELEADIDRLNTLESKYKLVKAKLERITPDEFDLAALGFTISNLYGIMESYLTRIAKCFENQIDTASWHRDLLRRMAIRVPDIRPAVLTPEQAYAVDQLRSFRHVFRHMYQQDLDPERLKLVDVRTPPAIEAFREAHHAFIEKLSEIITALDNNTRKSE